MWHFVQMFQVEFQYESTVRSHKSAAISRPCRWKTVILVLPSWATKTWTASRINKPTTQPIAKTTHPDHSRFWKCSPLLHILPSTSIKSSYLTFLFKYKLKIPVSRPRHLKDFLSVCWSLALTSSNLSSAGTQHLDSVLCLFNTGLVFVSLLTTCE